MKQQRWCRHQLHLMVRTWSMLIVLYLLIYFLNYISWVCFFLFFYFFYFWSFRWTLSSYGIGMGIFHCDSMKYEKKWGGGTHELFPQSQVLFLSVCFVLFVFSFENKPCKMQKSFYSVLYSVFALFSLWDNFLIKKGWRLDSARSWDYNTKFHN